MFLTIGCSSVATTGGGGGGGGGGGDGVGVYTGGLMGRGGQQWSGGGNSAVGGGQKWGCRQPLRTALHNISISVENSLS